MMKRRWWIAAALTVAVAVMVAVVVSPRRLLQPSTVAGSTYHPSDPARLATTGRPQLVEFFHHAWLGCRAMAPIVHGFEQQYGGRVDFLYLDVQDGRTATAKARLGFEATPHFFLLDADGRVLREWQGVIPADTLERGLRRVIGEDSWMSIPGSWDGSCSPPWASSPDVTPCGREVRERFVIRTYRLP